MKLNILLTGEPGVGKTTIIKAVLGGIRVRAEGFTTSEIRTGKTRKGFDLNVLGGSTVELAHINRKSTYKVGPYGVDVKAVDEQAVPAIEAALARPAPLLVIDEIGKMECFSHKFREVVIRALDAPIPLLGTLQTFAHPLINQILNRPDIVLIEITPSCRDLLVERVLELVTLQIKGMAQAGPPKKVPRVKR